MFPERTRDKVCIVGCSDSCKQTPFNQADEFEFWGVNNLYWTLPGQPFTRWFEIHEIEQNESGVWERRGSPMFRNVSVDVYLDQLAALDMPVHMREINPKVPKALLMPYDALVEKFGRYFTNTISWEIAMGIAMGFKEIRIYGVDMAVDTEYGHQRPSCEYFLGVAAGLGIKIWIPDTCDLLKTRFLYGKEEPQAREFTDKLQEILGNMEAKMKAENEKLKAAEQQVIQYHGAIMGVKNVDRIWKAVSGG